MKKDPVFSDWVFKMFTNLMKKNHSTWSSIITTLLEHQELNLKPSSYKDAALTV